MQLLDAEREARQRQKLRRSARQVQPELRMVARYVNEEWLTHTDYPPTYFPSQSTMGEVAASALLFGLYPPQPQCGVAC